MRRIKSTETTISCRIDKGQKDAFLKVLEDQDDVSHEPYLYRPGTIIRMMIRAYTDNPEAFIKLLHPYR